MEGGEDRSFSSPCSPCWGAGVLADLEALEAVWPDDRPWGPPSLPPARKEVAAGAAGTLRSCLSGAWMQWRANGRRGEVQVLGQGAACSE